MTTNTVDLISKNRCIIRTNSMNRRTVCLSGLTTKTRNLNTGSNLFIEARTDLVNYSPRLKEKMKLKNRLITLPMNLTNSEFFK